MPAWLSFDPTTRTFTGTPGAADLGNLTIRVIATDLSGATAFDDFVISSVSQNASPVAINDSASVLRNGSIIVPVRANDSDADGDALTVAGFTQGARGIVVVDTSSGKPKYTPNANVVGLESFNYTISDGHGATATATVSVTVASLMGDNGANTLTGTNAVDAIVANGGADTINTAGGNYYVDARSGNDTVRGGTGADTLLGGTGNDSFQVIANELTGDVIDGGAINGDGTANIITGTQGADDIDGNGGSDTLDGAAGNDIITGGAGADMVRGGAGADMVRGGAGNDTIRVTGHDLTGDTIDGGADTDTLLFTGNVTLSGGFAMSNVEIFDMRGFNLSVQTTSAVDLSALALRNAGVINGNNTANTITGTQGADTINGGNGSDLLKGGLGPVNIWPARYMAPGCALPESVHRQ